MGVSLIEANPLSIVALTGSILLPNLPEAAGGAKEMAADNHSKKKVLWLWIGTALILSIVALIGNYILTDLDTK